MNSLFFQSIKKGASDIHIESHENRGEVRIRIDGAFKKNIDLDRKITIVINRIKVISNLDIFPRKGVPQDGRTPVSISGKNLGIPVLEIFPIFTGKRGGLRGPMRGELFPLGELGLANIYPGL